MLKLLLQKTFSKFKGGEMKKKNFLTLIFIVITMWFSGNVFASNCLQHVGTFLEASGSHGVDSILVFLDDNDNLTNQALVTVNRDNVYNGAEIGSFLLRVTFTKNSGNDNVSMTINDNISLTDMLGITVSANHYAYSFLKAFYNNGVVGFTSFDNDSYVWFINDNQSFDYIKLTNIKLVDLAISKSDTQKFYALGNSNGNNKIYEINSDLSEYTEKYSFASGMSQILYAVDEEDGPELDLLYSGGSSTKIYEFYGTATSGIDFSNPYETSDEYDNVSSISLFLAEKEECNADYTFFKFNFDSIGIYKESETGDNETLVNVLKLWDPSSAYRAGNILYVSNWGAGINAVDISEPGTLGSADILGDTINDFYGLMLQVKGMVIDGEFYILGAGGWSGLGVFKAGACYANPSLDSIFQPLNCSNDNDTGSNDNESTSCTDGCFTAFDANNLGSGWSLAGTGCDIYDIPAIFNNVDTVWKWTGSAWAVFSPNTTIKTLLTDYNIPSINHINAKEGFWVKK